MGQAGVGHGKLLIVPRNARGPVQLLRTRKGALLLGEGRMELAARRRVPDHLGRVRVGPQPLLE